MSVENIVTNTKKLNLNSVSDRISNKEEFIQSKLELDLDRREKVATERFERHLMAYRHIQNEKNSKKK